MLSPLEVERLLKKVLVIEEKVDGTNLGFSADPTGQVRIQSRGSWLTPPFPKHLNRLRQWIDLRRDSLTAALSTRFVLFGEWLGAVHSIQYDQLPDWFLAFDVYDVKSKGFLSVAQRNAMCEKLGVEVVRSIAVGVFSFDELVEMLNLPSRYYDGPIEGIYLRAENEKGLTERVKLVRPEFVQAIGDHWKTRAIRWNRLGD